MKPNRLNMRVRPNKMGWGITLVGILALVVFSVPVSFATEARKTKAETMKNATQPTTKIEAVSEKLEDSVKKKSTVEINETQALSVSAVGDKGRQIKWQIICSGAGCGDARKAHWYGGQEVVSLCGSVGQVAVGPGSSPSFGMNSGFWQEFGEGFVCGDVNGDGVVNLGDVVYLISYVFRGGPPPDPYQAGDVNSDGTINLGDIVYLISYLYRGGPPPGC